MKTVKGRILPNLILLGVSTILGFTVAEVVLHIYEKQVLKKIAAERQLYKKLYRVSQDKHVSFEHHPNVNLRFLSTNGYYSMHVITNSEGLREEIEIPFEKRSHNAIPSPITQKGIDNEHRIVVLGDSIVFGASVDNDKTFLRVMEEVFREREFAVKTINFGMGSSNPMLEYHYLRYKEAARYHPTIVLLGFCLNDFDTRHTTFNPDLGIWETPEVQSTSTKQLLRDTLFKIRVIKLLNNFRHDVLFKSHTDRRKRDYEPSSDEIQSVRYWLGMMKKYTEESNIIFAVIIFPYRRQLEYALKTSHVSFALNRAVLRICSELDLPCYDLTTDLVTYLNSSGDKLTSFYWDDVHPWEAGHRVIGQLVSNWILENKWLDGRDDSTVNYAHEQHRVIKR